MKPLSQFLKQHSLAIGLLLMFLLTWPIDLSNSGVLPFKFPFAVYILLGYGFVLAALIMTALTQGRESVISLLKRFLEWRVGWQWYAVALLLLPLLDVLGVVLNSAIFSKPIAWNTVLAFKIFGPSANLAALFIPYLLFDAVTNGEEIGWRGYVLPRLQAKHSALVSSLILGLVWGFWHLPKFLGSGNFSYFVFFMADTVAKAVFLTWLYNNTGGSLLLTMLSHAAWNTASMVLPVANTVSGENMSASIITLVLLGVTVSVITVWAGPAQLSRTHVKQIESEASVPVGPPRAILRAA